MNLKVKIKAHEKMITNNTDQKNGLNVEHFFYHITINYDKM